jgi:hypothetical protein
MRRFMVLLTVLGLGVMVWAVPVGAGGSNSIIVNAVVNGTPTGPLQLTRTCGGSPADATSAPFTTSVSPAIPGASFPLSVTCTVAVTQAGGMTASFACMGSPPLDAVGITCNPGNDSVKSSTFRSATATITVTFDPAPTTTTPAAAAVEAPVAFTG